VNNLAIKFFVFVLVLLFALPGSSSAASVNHNVPNVLQAPTGKWTDARQKYGCEEASILMAWAWLSDKIFDPRQAEGEIIAMADFETNIMLGLHHDTSAADTAKLMREYYGVLSLRVENNITVEDLKAVLNQGAIAIVPVGFAKNARPFYPKPIARHTVVVGAYDETAQTFGINDPLYKNTLWIPEKVIAKSLRGYSTGINRPVRKSHSAMIVVSPR